jgi:hypothetical protein
MISFSIDDLRTPESTERVLRQFQQAMNRPIVQAAPALTAADLANITAKIRDQLQAGGQTPLNLQSLLPNTASSVFSIPSVVSGALPGGLGAADVGTLAWVTDYSHLLQWTGSAWTWGPADPGSGFYAMYESAPSGFGSNAWQLCNGSTVARFNADGTTTNVTVPDVTTAAYLKGALAAAAIAVASGNTPAGTVSTPTFTGTPGTTGNDSASVAVQSGAGTTVAADPHTHPFTPAGTLSTPTFTGNAMTTLELRNKTTALYYRR